MNDLSNDPSRPASPWMVYCTAFLEGAAVIIVEIAGARALAPFFGTSLQVWTAQITVTLLFLALGYGLGGLFAKRDRPFILPALFAVAGIWLAMYPLIRTPILDFTSRSLGVGIGSLVSASLLFGIPLLMLGSVSPVLINDIDRRRPGAGSAAGRLFFTNTMGGLVGGWVTAFVLVQHTSLRISLVATGIFLLLLALIWAFGRNLRGSTPVFAALLVAAGAVFFYQPPHSTQDKAKRSFKLLHNKQSGIGLLQVLDFDYGRVLHINGVIQGQMNAETGRASPADDYIHNLHIISYSHHPTATTALQLGLGAGLLPKELALRGLNVTAVEIEPQMVDLAKKYFQLPDSVDVRIADARAFLRHEASKYDLIFLDTFASESTAWHLLTDEAMKEMRERLNPGGRLIINTVAYAKADNAGLARLESTALSAFPQVLLYPGRPVTDDPQELINVTVVAGENLDPKMSIPDTEPSMQMLAQLISDSRPAAKSAPVMTDERCDLDYVMAPLRIRWRTLIWDSLESDVLWD